MNTSTSPISAFSQTAPYNKPNEFKEEGVDHININAQSKTTIGKVFDPEYIKVIQYPHLGKFSSVLSLWYWCRCPDKDDSVRRMVRGRLKAYAEQRKLYKNHVPNFKALIAQATWLKVKKYPFVLNEIKRLGDIQLLSYYTVKSSNVRITTKYAEFIIQIGEEIIKAVKEDREPDFDFLVDNPKVADLDYTKGILMTIVKNTEEVHA